MINKFKMTFNSIVLQNLTFEGKIETASLWVAASSNEFSKLPCSLTRREKLSCSVAVYKLVLEGQSFTPATVASFITCPCIVLLIIIFIKNLVLNSTVVFS